MEKQKYQIGDLVKVMYDEQPIDIRVGRVVSIEISEQLDTAFLYGVSFNLNGKIPDRRFLDASNNNGCLAAWIEGKVEITNIEEERD